MAQKWRKIDPRIWTDEVFDDLDQEQALAALWLLTTDRCNRLGIVVFSLAEATAKIRGKGIDTVWDTLSEVCTRFNWPLQRVTRDTLIVLFPKWFKYNPPSNQKHLQGMLSDLHDVPRCELVKDHLATLCEHLEEGMREEFDRVSKGYTIPTPIPYRKQEQKQKNKQEQNTNNVAGANGPPTVDEFYDRWKTFAEAKGLSVPVKLTGDRRAKIKRRLAEPGWFETFCEACTKLPLPEEKGSSWQPNLDWMIRSADNVTSIIEGKYDWRGKSGAQGQAQRTSNAIEEFVNE